MKLINELYEYRTMLTSLVHKDLVTRYKGSVLGFFLDIRQSSLTTDCVFPCFFGHYACKR